VCRLRKRGPEERSHYPSPPNGYVWLGSTQILNIGVIPIYAGYYNPLLAYGEERAINEAADAGVEGFIIVDLPPEEAVRFREACAVKRLAVIQKMQL
jgi:hypothetical protein